MKICGVDFTSAPKRDKKIVVAECEAEGPILVLKRFLEFADWPAYELWLDKDDEWVGGFDFPFGLPRRFVEAQRWPSDWHGMVRACVAGGKERFADAAMQAFIAARTPQDKHRETDLAANSHSPLKTRTNPPVGLMFYEGSWRLLKHDIRIPGLFDTTSRKIAVEAYPGFVVRQLRERYYKNDKGDAGAGKGEARSRIVNALLTRSSDALSCTLSLGSRTLEDRLLHASGDWLDAVLCATQAHWSWLRRDANFGLPQQVDPREGWIIAA